MIGPGSGKRLVLCFDGTGNEFSGNESDTNVVKIYDMLDRTCPDQYHYYQPGIGTYDQSAGLGANPSSGWFISRLKSYIGTATDQAVGSTFADHVIAGYQFIMRYYSDGDAIYIFGFSRGAYTARFLAEMVHGVGMLSKGNEEMVHFAWKTFSGHQQICGKKAEHKSKKDKDLEEKMRKFKATFCRPHVKVQFLGLFDCVNSVGQFELPFLRSSFEYVPSSAADHIRHAVSINERRLKFKPALFQLDDRRPDDQDMQEVWFAGNHADIGGGWDRENDHNRLLSDIPLAWMIDEINALEGRKTNRLAFKDTTIPRPSHVLPCSNLSSSSKYATQSHNKPHDMLALGKGTSWSGVLTWWILEVLPFFTRLELEDGAWIPRHWPPNLGSTRDIPRGATIHESVKRLFEDGVLTEQQLPREGGDQPSLVVKMWRKPSDYYIPQLFVGIPLAIMGYFWVQNDYSVPFHTLLVNASR